MDWLAEEEEPLLHTFHSSAPEDFFWKQNRFPFLLGTGIGLSVLLAGVLVFGIMLLVAMNNKLPGILVLGIGIPGVGLMAGYIYFLKWLTTKTMKMLVKKITINAHEAYFEILRNNIADSTSWGFAYKDVIEITDFKPPVDYSTNYYYQDPRRPSGLNSKLRKLPQGVFFNPQVFGLSLYSITLRHPRDDGDIMGDKKYEEILIDIEEMDRFRDFVRLGGGRP